MKIILITLFFTSIAFGQTNTFATSNLNTFKISPNPVVSDFEISVPKSNLITLVEVYDVIGDILFRKELIGTTIVSVKAPHWISGSYIVRVTQGEKSVIKRLIKV